MRVGIIAEGPTDQRVIEEILKGAVRGGDDGPAPLELQVNYVHPEAQGFGGWALVFDALRRGQHIEALQYNDYLVIQLDTDVCEELGFDVPRREAGVELDEATLIARVIARVERELGPAFVAEHGSRVAYAIAVNELECWLLPLVFDNNKADKTTGCFEALHRRLKERKGRGLLHNDGQSKDPRRYRDEAAPLRKPKQLEQACEHSASLAAFVLRVRALAAAYRITGPPGALAPP